MIPPHIRETVERITERETNVSNHHLARTGQAEYRARLDKNINKIDKWFDVSTDQRTSDELTEKVRELLKQGFVWFDRKMNAKRKVSKLPHTQRTQYIFFHEDRNNAGNKTISHFHGFVVFPEQTVCSEFQKKMYWLRLKLWLREEAIERGIIQHRNRNNHRLIMEADATPEILKGGEEEVGKIKYAVKYQDDYEASVHSFGFGEIFSAAA